MVVTEEKRSEKFGRDGVTITRTFRVTPYSQRDVLIDHLLGYVKVFNGTLIRVPPAADPYFPWAFCREATCEHVEVLNSPENPVTGLSIVAAKNYSESARVVATFSTLDYDEQTQSNGSPNADSEKELASEHWDFGYTSQRQPNHFWTIPNGTNTVTLAQAGLELALTYAKIEYRLMRHYCVNLPTNAMTKLANRVNEFPFRVGGKLWDKETVRYESTQVNRKTTNKGIGFFELDHRFAVFPHWDYRENKLTSNRGYVGWNRMWAPQFGFWARPTLIVNANEADPMLKNRSIYLYAEDINQTVGNTVIGGFDLLFHPSAT